MLGDIIHMGVSINDINGGTNSWMVYNGRSYLNG